MKRIFLFLAALTVLALCITYAVGLLSWSRDGLTNVHDSTYLVHFYLGLYTSIGVLMIHCLVITYFLGTGRWIKEVTLAYDLPDERWARPSRDIKRAHTPRAISAMLLTIATAAAGFGRQLQEWPAWVHLTLACIALLVNAGVFVLRNDRIRANGRMIDEVMETVERMRAEHGLLSSEEALQRDET